MKRNSKQSNQPHSQGAAGQRGSIRQFLKPIEGNVGTPRSGAEDFEDSAPEGNQSPPSKARPAEESEVSPAPAKKKAKTSSSKKEQSPETGDRKVVGWLNKLLPEEASAIESALLGTIKVRSEYLVSGSTVEVLRTLTNTVEQSRSGAWYANEFARCTVPVTAAAAHGRYQIKINASSSASQMGVMTQALSRLDTERGSSLLAEFRALPGDPDSENAVVKITRHVLAYAAGRSEGDAEIPLNLGAGSSISHLCDTTGCIEKSHLRVELAHKDNLVRQRCRGVRLTVSTWNRRILQEEPCVHGNAKAGDVPSSSKVMPEALSLEDQLLLSCRKVQLVDVGETKETAQWMAFWLSSEP